MIAMSPTHTRNRVQFNIFTGNDFPVLLFLISAVLFLMSLWMTVKVIIHHLRNRIHIHHTDDRMDIGNILSHYIQGQT